MQIHKIPIQPVGTLVLALSIAGCSDSKERPAATEVQIRNAADTSKVLGQVTLEDRDGEGLIAAFNISSNDVISPGEHAIHIHTNGSCDPADANRDGELENAGAAGGHFNPTDVGHGGDNGPHVGDSENYNHVFTDDGSFVGEIRFPKASLFGENSVMGPGGTAIIIHEGVDDTTSDPSGDAGARIACGVISAADENLSKEVDVVSAAAPTQRLGSITVADRPEGGVVARFQITANDVLTPGSHAIHIHENASCEAADINDDGELEPAGAAGGHYNPEKVGHGEDNGPHVGDSAEYNYSFESDGSFEGEVVFAKAGLYKDYPLLAGGGTAIVIHRGTDDTSSDPSGDAGERVACAVIAP